MTTSCEPGATPSSVPSVDAVVVTYNSKDVISRCIACLQADGVRSVTVVDSASTDGTAELVATLPVRLVRAKNRGFGAGCNLGARLSDAEFLFFVNPDAEVVPGSVRALVDLHATGRSLGREVASSCLEVSEGGYLESVHESWFFSVELYARKLLGQPLAVSSLGSQIVLTPRKLTGAALFLSRGLFEAMGGFDERFFLYREDADLSLRMQKAGALLAIPPSAVAVHARGSSTEATEGIDVVRARSTILYVRKHLGRPGLMLALLDILLASTAGATIELLRGRPSRAKRRIARLAALTTAFSHNNGRAER